MALKQSPQALQAPDGSYYVTLTDGAGNLYNTGTTITGGATLALASITANDGMSNSQTGFGVAASSTSTIELLMQGGYGFNGTTWDRNRTIVGAVAAGTGTAATMIAPTSAAPAALASTATAAVNSALVLKATAGNLYSISVTSGASAGFVMIFDAASAPADGAVTPVDVITVAANATVAKTYSIPVRCATGITAVFSTTGPFSKTASATAFIAGQFA